MTIKQPFAPTYGSTQTFTPAASSSVAIAIDPQGNNKQVRVVNTGANIGFFRLGAADMPAATAADMPVPPNMAVTVTKEQGFGFIRHISAAGTTFIVTCGEGW